MSRSVRTVRIVLNGQELDVVAPATVAAAVAVLGLRDRILLAELNGDPVERTRWSETSLADNDRLEVVRVVAGG